MSGSGTDCCCTCGAQLPPVNIPGAAGATGAAGADGSNGVSSFAIVTPNDIVVPVNTVTDTTYSVSNTTWMVVGETLNIGQGGGVALANPGPAQFVITAIPSSTSVTVRWNGLPSGAGGTTISKNAIVSPGGTLPATPITVALGGTNAATISAAQVNLGLGQDAIITSNDGLAQDFTNAFVEVGTIDVSIPAPVAPFANAAYLVKGSVSIEASGLTFGANQTLLIRIRDITNNVTVAQITRHTDTPTTIHIPSIDWVLPDTNFGVSGALHLQLQIQNLTGAAPGAGTLRAIGGYVSALPIRKYQ